jgi:two-component system copper resistance phosphate regulon response regulator CusR
MRLLIAEDDPQLGALLARGLREQAYVVDRVTDGTSAIEQLRLNDYDGAILDVMLPGADGFAVTRAARARGASVPILMLTARDAVEDRITGLDAGADDYLVKPFAFDELLARLRALLRRGPRLAATQIVIGDLAIDTRSQTASRAGQPIALTTKEYTLLEYLARQKGCVVSRADISAHVWDDNHDPLSNAIEVYINRLRKKLGGRDAASFIETRRGAGYRLIDPETDATPATRRPAR